MKKIPIRTCIGCNEGKPKRELIRIVKTAEGEISIDSTGKKNGRGAYICPSISCLDKAIKTKRLARAFEMQIENELYASLRESIEVNGED